MVYVCEMCGYQYNEKEGIPDQGITKGTKFENLSDDFVCPICGAPKDSFFKVEK